MSELGHPSWGPELGPEHYRKTQFTRVRRVRAGSRAPAAQRDHAPPVAPLVGRAARAGPLGPVRLPRPNTCPRRLMGGGGSNHAPGVEPHFHISPWHKHGVRPAPRVAVGERALARFRGRAKSPSRPRITRASRPLSTARAPAPSRRTGHLLHDAHVPVGLLSREGRWRRHARTDPPVGCGTADTATETTATTTREHEEDEEEEQAGVKPAVALCTLKS